MNEFFPLAITAGGVGLLLFACLHDAALRTIPNWVSLALAAAGLVLGFGRGSLPLGLGIALALGLGLGVLWVRGFIGGGDVKLVPAVSLLLPPAAVPDFILATALAGGVLALLYLAASRLVPSPSPGRRRGLLARVLKAEARRMRRSESLPYAVAIAAGALAVIVHSFPGVG